MMDEAAERSALLDAIVASRAILPREGYAELPTPELRRIAERQRKLTEEFESEGRLGALWAQSGFNLMRRGA